MNDQTAQGFLRFPDGFLWGAATSAFQIEGALDEDGRGPSIWDTFTNQPGKIYKGQNAREAAGHYHRWAEDLELMRQLGLGAYRFSTAWPRIQPGGSGPANQAGLDFYDRLVDGLLERGIQPFLTLFHWDLPQALQDAGGWTNPRTAEHFAEYARLVANCLGDRVRHWITLNEPISVTVQGHLFGEHAPGLQDPFAALQSAVNQLRAHGLAVQALRSELPAGARVGITLNFNPVHPASASEEDRTAAHRIDTFANRLFVEPLYTGRLPADLLDMLGPLAAAIQPQDVEPAAAPLDFLGVNYYSRLVVRHQPDIPFVEAQQVFPNGNEYSQMWEIYPQGLYDLLTWLHDAYRPACIYITENGVPVPDGIDRDGRIRDYRRIRYLRDHLLQVHRALEAGVPVNGYFVWSLLDNFEWAFGYQMRFGLIYVDFDTLERSIKESGRWYSEVIRRSGFDPQLNHC